MNQGGNTAQFVPIRAWTVLFYYPSFEVSVFVCESGAEAITDIFGTKQDYLKKHSQKNEKALKKEKKIMKKFTKIATLALAAAMISTSAVAFASCQGNKKTIGIMKFGSFGSLNNCEEGILKGLEEEGITKDNYNIVLYDDNFQGDTAAAHASALVNQGASVIVGIATPSAMAAANAADGSIPVVYCAVTDDTNLAKYANVCGTSDIPDYKTTLELVTSVMEKEDLTIGVLEYVNESSDAAMVSAMQTAAQAYEGMSVKEYKINDMTTISTIVEAASKEVDCFVNILDSTIVSQLETILATSTVPVFGSEVEQTVDGCIASVSYDYIMDIGRQAGIMAAKIVKGEKTAKDCGRLRFTVPEYTPEIYYNADAMEKFGKTAPKTVSGITVKSTAKYTK